MNRSPAGTSVHGIAQARILEWVVISSSKDLSDTGMEPASVTSPALAGGFFTSSAPWEVGIFHLPRGISPNPPSKITANQEFYCML